MLQVCCSSALQAECEGCSGIVFTAYKAVLQVCCNSALYAERSLVVFYITAYKAVLQGNGVTETNKNILSLRRKFLEFEYVPNNIR